MRDVWSFALATRSFCQPLAERLLAVFDIVARNQGLRNVLELSAIPCSQIGNGLFGEMIQFSTLDILFKLFIPNLRLKFLEPCPEASQFVRRELRNGNLKFLNRSGSHILVPESKYSTATLWQFLAFFRSPTSFNYWIRPPYFGCAL